MFADLKVTPVAVQVPFRKTRTVRANTTEGPIKFEVARDYPLGKPASVQVKIWSHGTTAATVKLPDGRFVAALKSEFAVFNAPVRR